MQPVLTDTLIALFAESPEEFLAEGTKCRLPEELGHKFMTIWLMCPLVFYRTTTFGYVPSTRFRYQSKVAPIIQVLTVEGTGQSGLVAVRVVAAGGRWGRTHSIPVAILLGGNKKESIWIHKCINRETYSLYV